MSGPRVVAPHQLGEVMDALARGCAVAVPGDGGYQLAVRHAHPEALARIGASGIPARGGEVRIVVGHRSQAAALTTPWNTQTSQLTDRMWPGPLTVILPGRPDACVPAASGDGAVHLIMPAWRPLRSLARRSGPLAVKLLRRADGGALVSADEVRAQLIDVDTEGVVFVVDGGLCSGPTSTVVDCTLSPPRVQRIGALPESYVEAALLMGARKRTWFTRRNPDERSR